MGGFGMGFKKLSIEDKILLIMECFCYLLTIGTLIAVIFAVRKDFIIGVGILLFSAVGFIGCGLNARISRDTYVNKKILKKKINKINDNILYRFDINQAR